jgi:GxxExxY protein
MKHEEITHKIIGGSMEGIVNLVPVFKSTFIIEHWKRIQIATNFFESEYEIKIFYKGDQIGLRKVDFLVEELIPVEIKASELTNLAQSKNYLEAGGIEIGLLLNFGAPSLQFKRLINSRASIS